MSLASPQHSQHINNIKTSFYSCLISWADSNINIRTTHSSFFTFLSHTSSYQHSKPFIYPFTTPKCPILLESMRKKSTLTWIRGCLCEALAATVPKHLTESRFNNELEMEVFLVQQRRRQQEEENGEDGNVKKKEEREREGILFLKEACHVSHKEWSRLAPLVGCHLALTKRG